ncbi:MAG: cupin domain-containing protein [Oceanospirillaceae bacterium]
MRAFSDVLTTLGMQVDIYHNAKVCGQWLISEHGIGATCFHIVTEGRCKLQVPGHLDCVLNCGDLIIFPRELAHTMSVIDEVQGEQQHLEFALAKDRQGTGMLCGEVKFTHPAAQQVLNELPAVFIIEIADSVVWLKALLELIMYENYHPSAASSVILNNVSELLFVYALQYHFTQQKQDQNQGNGSFLALYHHPRLSKAIEAVHKDPQQPWTLASLAQTASQSRTSFSTQFKQVSGWSVMQYLTWWRMQLAWNALIEGRSVANVAAEVGYHSESAFSRVFLKSFAVSAGKVRRNPQHYKNNALKERS